jgi:hypothetical protein
MASSMTTYNTGAPVPSVDVRDLYDNAENLDNFSNGAALAYTDRKGVSRQSLAGIRAASSYQHLGAYAAGLVFTSYNQTFSYLGEFYAPSAGVVLPYTTTGAGAGEIATFRSVGDALLRSDLASSSGAGVGSGMVAYAAAAAYPSGSVGAELRKTITPAAYGVKTLEEGATDPTAELAKWETMRLAAKSLKARVLIPKGTYVFPAGVRLDADNTDWEFSRGSLIKLWDTQATQDFIVISKPVNQKITGLRFDANRANQNRALFGPDRSGCIVVSPDNFKMYDTHIVSSPAKGLSIVGEALGVCRHFVISGVTGGDCGDQAFLLDGNNSTTTWYGGYAGNVDIGTTGHVGMAVNDGVHNVQFGAINCETNNPAWAAVSVRDCSDLQFSTTRGAYAQNGIEITSLNIRSKRIMLGDMFGEFNGQNGVLINAAINITGGAVGGRNNGAAGLNIAQRAVAETGAALITCNNISISSPIGYDDRGVAQQQYGVLVAGADNVVMGKEIAYGNTASNFKVLRAAPSTNVYAQVEKFAAVTIPSIAASSWASVSITWPTAFDDAEYTVSLEIDFGSTSPALQVGHFHSKVAAGCSVVVLNESAGTIAGAILNAVARRKP